MIEIEKQNSTYLKGFTSIGKEAGLLSVMLHKRAQHYEITDNRHPNQP